MKNIRIVILLTILICLTVGYIFYPKYKYSSNPDKTKIGSYRVVNSNSEKGDSADINASFAIYNEFEELAYNSDIVVIGYCQGENGKTRNLFRNVSDPSKESDTRKGMTKEFDFKVEKWVKGTGPDVINLAVQDYFSNAKAPEIKHDGPHKFPNKGKRSLLFLQTVKGFEDFYLPVSPIYLFEISDNGKLNPLLKETLKVNTDKIKDYDEEKVIKLVSEVKIFKKDKK